MRLQNVLNVVNCHTEGVVCDVVTGGMGKVPGETMFDKQQYFEQNLDHIRTMLVLEPRAGLTRSVNILLPSNEPTAEFGFLILETTELVEMSGGNIISVATVLLETGMVPMVEPVTEFFLESPAGLIKLECRCADGKVKSVTFTNQPAFVYLLDEKISVPGLGEVRVDVAWGGMVYVLVEARDVGLELIPANDSEIVRLGELIKKAAIDQLTVVNPVNPDFSGISCTLFTDELHRDGDTLRSRNAVVVSPGFIDRCPCGTGTCARLAVMHARGEIAVGEEFTHRSVIGTEFKSTILRTADVHGVPAIIPTVTGRAWITGLSQVGVDPDDPFPNGFSMATLADGSVATRL